MKRKQKKYDDDDGHTIIDMNIDGMPWYTPNKKEKVSEEDLPTKKERRTLIKAGYLAYLPVVLSILFGMGFTVMLLYLWLHGWSFT